MRKRALQVVHKLAIEHKEVVYIGSDVGQGTLEDMRTNCPDQFFVEAISEAHVIGMAAGMAMCGHVPYVNTIGTFLTRRCLDQIAVDLCIGKHPVRLIANGGGLVYAPLGPTHQAIEDMALMRCLPNMTVVAPCDADEMERVIEASLSWPLPMYIRVARGGDPIVSKPEHPFQIGKVIEMAKGQDLLLVTTGIMLQEALKVRQRLAGKMDCGIVHCPTIKPLDEVWFKRCLKNYAAVAVLEEHTTLGGLGSAIAEVFSESDRHPGARFKRFGIPDCFAEHYGNQASLLQGYGLDAESLSVEILEWLE